MTNNLPEKKTIELPEVLSVKQLADFLDQPVTAIITKLMGFGVLANINEDIDFDTAAIVADEFGIPVVKKESLVTKSKVLCTDDSSCVEKRPPVVAIMGHVDHGKTTLLDTIRKTNVAGKEVGGITQHISSYQIEVLEKGSKEKRLITFLDTPGHAAFEAMRRHGAQITDVVVLIVAADDGVKPQTKEAINHARVLNVPIIVAINKIDKPEADPERVKRELAELNLVPEEWGGKTIMTNISAKNGDGIPELIDMVLLATDMRDLRANFSAPAVGVVIESHQEVGIGTVATVLIQNGTLRLGDHLSIGDVYGKVRTMSDFRGKKVIQATPSMPVEISGLASNPRFGEQLVVFANEKDAKDSAREYLRSQTAKKANVSLSALNHAAQKEGDKTILNVVVKADMDGSLEAIKNGLENMKNEDVEVRVISSGVGDISENDITMAATTHSVLIAFQVRLSSTMKMLADREKVTISLYSIVYELFEAVRTVLAELMPMVTVEKTEGRLKILSRFRDNKKNVVVGGQVFDGTINPKNLVRVVRGGEVIAEGTVASLRHGREEVKTVKSGSECGMELNFKFGAEMVEKNDILDLYSISEERKALNI